MDDGERARERRVSGERGRERKSQQLHGVSILTYVHDHACVLRTPCAYVGVNRFFNQRQLVILSSLPTFDSARSPLLPKEETKKKLRPKAEL